MTKSHSDVKADDLDTKSASHGESQANASHRYQVVLRQLDDGPKFTREWFLLKEEEMELRCHLNRNASRSSELVINSSRLEDKQAVSSNYCDDYCTGDVGGNNASTGAIAGAIPDSSNNNDSVRAPTNADRLTSLRTDVSSFRVYERNLKCTENTAAATLLETLDSADSNDLPIPLSGHCEKFVDGSTSKKIAIASKTLVHKEGAPVPCVLSADVPVTQNLTPAKATKETKHKHSASRKAERAALPRLSPMPGAEPNYTNEDQALLNREIVQQSSVMHTAVDITYGLQSSPHFAQETSNLPCSVSDVLSRSSPSESVQREEEKEDIIIIPEAFMVTENAPEVQIAEVAELVEPDPSRLSLKKRHACLFLVCVAAILALGIGLTMKFTSRNVASIRESTGTDQRNDRSFSPSSQPSFDLLSLEPSVQPSSLSIRYEIEANVLQRNATFDGNRGLALEWIMNTDALQLEVSDSNLYQRYILVLLSFEFNISEWWLSGSSECYWQGVGCGSNGTVFKLELDNVNLIGTIPPEIGGLRFLKHLSFGYNYLDGTLPSELGKLTSLTYLYIGNNDLQGNLPSELGNIQELTHLNFEYNAFNGTIPSDLRHLNALTKLSVAGNEFSGPFPSWLVESFSLIEYLHLENNWLTGPLPSEIGMLKTLVYLDIHVNRFISTLPPDIGELTLLTHLDISSNSFAGILPAEIGKLALLNHLDVSSNSFTGILPSEIGKLTSLTYLAAKRQRLSGSIPSELRQLNSLTTFSVAGNEFSGPFPSWLVESLSLIEYLHLDINHFTGTLPSEIGTLTTLAHLDVSNNKIKGTLPSEIGQLTSLTFLDVGSNHFEGTLPTEIGKLTLLTYLDVSNGSFRGMLPSEIGILTSLTYLRAYENQLTGMIPSEIGNMVQLTQLFLHFNQLTGMIPTEIGKLVQLTDLWLHDNQLTGPLPPEIGYLTSLTTLWVGRNNLNGTVSAELSNLSEVWQLYLGVNNFMGTIPSQIGQLSKLTELFIHENLFTGHLPPNLKTCWTGMTKLCFHGNLLTGVLPGECGCA